MKALSTRRGKRVALCGLGVAAVIVCVTALALWDRITSECLLLVLQNGEQKSSCAAAGALGSLGDARVIPRLLRLTVTECDGDCSACQPDSFFCPMFLALFLTVRNCGKDAVPFLMQGLHDPETRSAVPGVLQWVFGNTWQKAFIPEFVKLANDPDPVFRQDVLGALGFLCMASPLRELGQDGTDAIEVLMEQASAGQPCRQAAISGLGLAGRRLLSDQEPVAEEIAQLLIRALDDPDSGVSNKAASSLVEMEIQDISTLCRLLKEGDPDVRKKAVDVLGCLGSRASEALPQLTEALDDTDWWVRDAARGAIESIQNAGAPTANIESDE